MALLAALSLVGTEAPLASQTPELERLRSAALEDLFVLRDYRPGKNSFVESPDRHVGTWTGQGYRYTLADLKTTPFKVRKRVC